MFAFRLGLRQKCYGHIKNCVTRTLTSEAPQCQEVSIPVPWGEIRGKWWGPRDIRPILTLHGWQDNCGSHDRLIPLLNKDVSFLAIDLPGHGYSSHLPLGMYYHFTTYLIALKLIKRYLQWPKLSLMGHSLGGITSYTYTMFFPDEVDFCICIDGAKPMSTKRTNKQIASFINKFLKNNDFEASNTEPPSYTLEEIKQKIHAPNKGSVSLEYAHYLMERSIAPSKMHPNKYYFTRDPRLKSGELYVFPQEDIVQFTHEITCPIFICKAKQGSYYEVKENFYECVDVLKRTSKDCDFHYTEGTHHAHLNNPKGFSEVLKKFIQRHAHEEDRSIGGLRDEIIVKSANNTLINKSR